MNDRARELAEKYGISEADLHVLTSLPADPTTDSVPKATATAHAPGMLAVAVRDAGQRAARAANAETSPADASGAETASAAATAADPGAPVRATLDPTAPAQHAADAAHRPA